MSTETQNKPESNSISAIDAAINAAKSRKATRTGSTPADTTNTKPVTSGKRTKLTDEEKTAREAAKQATRAAKKTERDAARAAKKAERDAGKAPAHMKKVLRAAEKLPALNEAAQLQVNDITANFAAGQVAAISAHLQHFNRVKATERALSQKLEKGMQVRIVSGDSRFIGKTGTVTKAQRIRAYVAVEGSKKDLYIFSSDAEPIAAKSASTKSA